MCERDRAHILVRTSACNVHVYIIGTQAGMPSCDRAMGLQALVYDML